MGKATILLVVGFLIIGGFVLSQINQASTSGVETSVSNYAQTVAHNCAVSAVKIAISQLSNQQALSTYSNLPMLGGNASLDTVNLSKTLVEICGRGWVSGHDTAVVRTVVDLTGGAQPPNVRGAITANADVRTLGTLIVDGREHNINGNLIENSGTLAISTTEIFDPGGNSMVAGTYADSIMGPTDTGPMKTGYENIVEDSAHWENDFPPTPDLFMGGAGAGYPEGKLKQLAMSGKKGSQYVTDPSDLRVPLHGVTYVELADGATWGNIDFGTSSGILVVHNSSGNAKIKNLNTGTFRGLIIADEIIHIHCNIIGAVAASSPNPADGNCIGNGTGNILYSTKALRLASTTSARNPGNNLAVVSWYE